MRCSFCGAWVSLSSDAAKSTLTICDQCKREEIAFAEMGMQDYAKQLAEEDEENPR